MEFASAKLKRKSKINKSQIHKSPSHKSTSQKSINQQINLDSYKSGQISKVLFLERLLVFWLIKNIKLSSCEPPITTFVKGKS
jgi:hypothetical protein